MINSTKEWDFMDNKEKICSICLSIYEGYGNNAEPLNKGRCCDECNLKVILARIELLNQSEWKCSYGKSCECNSDVEKSECDLAYKTKMSDKKRK